ncbi:MAG TPA: FtsX-like permease family protein, partial [Actinomycetota bacterium]|nr:FtsX-like permease family protein [Actinomycetota bacterium]
MRALRALPTILRVAWRDFRRRPPQTVLIVAGLVVASLVISASMVAADSIEDLFLENSYRAWGPVDVSVGSISGQPFPREKALAFLADPQIKSLTDGGAPRLMLRAAVENLTRKTREPAVVVSGLDTLDASLGGFKFASGKGADLQGATVVIDRRLAERLEARVGDDLSFLANGLTDGEAKLNLAVVGIVEDTGKGDFRRSPNAFVDLGAMRAAVGAPDVVNEILLSANGSPRSPRHPGKLEAAARRVTAQIFALPGQRPGVDVRGTKAQDLKDSVQQSKFFRAILSMLGAIVALASIALIANLFVMLGEERRSERGTMRALGLGRLELVLLGIAEGVLYSAAAAIVGSFAGAFFGRYLARTMGDIFRSFTVDSAFDFATPSFALRPATLITAGVAGFIVSIVSVAAVTIRTSRLTVIAAVRGLPEGRARRRRKVPWFQLFSLSLAGFLVAAYFGMRTPGKAVSTGGSIVQVLGGGFLIMGVAGLLARYWQRRVGYTLGALAGLGWGLWSNTFLPNFDEDPQGGFGLITMIGVMTVMAGVFLLASNLSVFRSLAVLLGGKGRVVLKTATAYADGYRFRSSMSMAMFGLVLYMIAAFAIWGGFGGGDAKTQGGGFDILATSTVPVRNFDLRGATDVVPMYSTVYRFGYTVAKSQPVNFPVRVFGVDESFSKNSHFKFSAKKGRSDRATWDLLAGSDDLVVLDTATNPGSAKVGDTLQMRSDSGTIRLKVAGVSDEFLLAGLFVSKDTFARIFPSAAADRAWLFKAGRGVKP